MATLGGGAARCGDFPDILLVNAPDTKMTELSQQFRDRECPGIAAFLEMIDGEDDQWRAEIFQLVLANVAGVRQTTISDPLAFFTTFFQLQQRKSPFIDDGVKLLDMACREAMLIWQLTERE